MPPSGFSPLQSAAISAFLRSCVEALINENRGLRTPAEAIQRELEHINADFWSQKRSAVPTATLELARAFYERLLAAAPADLNRLEEVSERLLSESEREILAIKVVDTPRA